MDKSKLLYSSMVADNATAMKSILQLYGFPGASILDMTYGKGTFWKNCNGDYNVTSNDPYVGAAEHSYDARATEFDACSFDVCVMDPPYSVKETGKRGSSAAYNRYGDAEQTRMSSADNVVWYKDAAIEAHRLLRPKGILLLKVQDQVNSGKQDYKHAHLLVLPNYEPMDLIIVTYKWLPIWDPKWVTQVHARKNHSYFIVHRKKALVANA